MPRARVRRKLTARVTNGLALPMGSRIHQAEAQAQDAGGRASSWVFGTQSCSLPR